MARQNGCLLNGQSEGGSGHGRLWGLTGWRLCSSSWAQNIYTRCPCKGQCLNTPVARKPGIGREHLSCSLISHLGALGHEMRILNPSTMATSNFPSMKYSATPWPQSAQCLEGRRASSLPCTHHTTPQSLETAVRLCTLPTSHTLG